MRVVPSQNQNMCLIRMGYSSYFYSTYIPSNFPQSTLAKNLRILLLKESPLDLWFMTNYPFHDSTYPIALRTHKVSSKSKACDKIEFQKAPITAN